jgi:hypothetical protein
VFIRQTFNLVPRAMPPSPAHRHYSGYEIDKHCNLCIWICLARERASHKNDLLVAYNSGTGNGQVREKHVAKNRRLPSAAITYVTSCSKQAISELRSIVLKNNNTKSRLRAKLAAETLQLCTKPGSQAIVCGI